MKGWHGRLGGLLLWGLGLAMLFPLVVLVSGSLMQSGELMRRIGPVFLGEGMAQAVLLPEVTSLRSYVSLLLDSQAYLSMFWNSCAIVLPTLAIQLGVSALAAWSFARYRFPLKNALFFLYTVLMMLPFQVTMAPVYAMLERTGLIGTHAGVVASQAFQTLGVFLLRRFFEAIPPSLIEAAGVDGAGEAGVFVRVALPLAVPGLLSLLVLGYIDLWNMVEPPLLFLRDAKLWPLSLYSTVVTKDSMGVAFAGSVITLLPPVLLFLFGQTYLEQGIMAMGVKE